MTEVLCFEGDVLPWRDETLLGSLDAILEPAEQAFSSIMETIGQQVESLFCERDLISGALSKARQQCCHKLVTLGFVRAHKLSGL